MSAEEGVASIHIENVDVNAENGSNSEKSSDSGVETIDACSETFPETSDSETSPIKSITTDKVCLTKVANNEEKNSENGSLNHSSLSSPISTTPDEVHTTDSLSYDESSPSKNENLAKDTPKTSSECSNNDDPSTPIPNIFDDKSFNINSALATSTMSLDNPNSSKSILCKSPYSRSAENISTIDDKSSLTLSNNNLDKDEILSQFTSHKNKVAAVHKIPDNTNYSTKLPENTDGRYHRIPKEILSQDIGSLVKNVHGIFSSVSGSLKYAYNARSTPKLVKNAKPIPNSKVMNDIFEDETNESTKLTDNTLETTPNAKTTNPVFSIDNDTKQDAEEHDSDAKKDVLKLQVETLERLLFEQRKENASLREQVKQQTDNLQEKDQTFRELEVKLDLMSKRVEQAEREKDAAVMRYASVECAAIEARRSAEASAATEKAAQAEAELLGNKLRSAHSEKHRIIQLYDDKCHELQNCDRELSKVREDVKELEGRLKWTQSKLRMEMDAYKESSERAEKLSQQVAELEAAKESAVANATDTFRAKQFESELKECQAALILCRHEKEELERRLSSTSQLLEVCKKERDDASSSLVETTLEVEKLKISNARLEEEAAELAALRAQAALADSLSAQAARSEERARAAEEALAAARALADTCLRREATALEHAAALTQRHVAERQGTEHYEAKAQALSADNASLRERITTLEAECGKLQDALREETERRNKENRALARKVAELTEEVAQTNKMLEWEKGENGVLKKKHASAIKELNRELQRALKRCEQLEAKLPPPDANSNRTGSISSLSSVESTQTEDRLQNGHAEGLPEIQVREPDRQALIERIVSLQRAAARRAERCEFLEEHSKQLTAELRNKSRLLRHMLSAMPAGAVASEDRDMNKKEIARLGSGAMAAVWGGDPAGMTLELSLEMNRRLQAVLEDTLLKNITLKENMDTLGAEISRLKEKRSEVK